MELTLKEFITKTDIRCYAVSGIPFYDIIFDFDSLVPSDYHIKFYKYLNLLQAYNIEDIIDHTGTAGIEGITYEISPGRCEKKILTITFERDINTQLIKELPKLAEYVLRNLYDHIILNINIYPSYDDKIKMFD